MALRVGEHRDARAVRHVHGPRHPAPTEALDLSQRRLEVPDLHVEGDVALASFGGGADAAVDAALYAGVRHRVVRARRPHLPVKGVPVEALEGLGILPTTSTCTIGLLISFSSLLCCSTGAVG